MSALSTPPAATGRSGFLRRFTALLRKEARQMLRDRSNLAVGLLLPVMLILLFGYGLSFDVKNVPLAVVMEDSSPTARDVVAGLNGSPYLSPVWMTSAQVAEQRLRDGEVQAILRVPADFSRQLAIGQAPLQLVLNGVDSNTAASVEGYVAGALGQSALLQAARSGVKATGGPGSIELVPRMWFNEASTSTWYLVPGLIVLVMTLIGAFLTSLLIAREWERGTLESLFVTPVRPLEIVLAKLVPYLVVGAIDLAMCLLAARYLFEVPIRGSLAVIVASSMLYLAVALLLGLFISGVTRNQFEASQIAMLASFMPAMMLSGFVFDLRNVPVAVQVISQLLPATHFMGLVKTLFLAGDNRAMILRDGSILAVYAVVLLLATRRLLRKTLD
ncbi:ABC transporter permease [Rhizobacter sp. SG703]|uniref:ABC transporter permease n=1 Tax=Rhizobacter sp. SG703 TaxID=2587140 RepID=UPI001445B888|nr:ABC transporter permease [Rhizobacter sp. SG703]NKI92489.1 ABC-2 type transport system permease protein [Rhizobacter sp. SG703]